ncbi:hypothetical protein FXO38_08004 [Capsicum annuum]|nr:hypothetical protein FXO37_10568 [Capsicum annuum]KAF3668604.1 hypothetical protein FXO38_08004 [Capsicum annuum]
MLKAPSQIDPTSINYNFDTSVPPILAENGDTAIANPIGQGKSTINDMEMVISKKAPSNYHKGSTKLNSTILENDATVYDLQNEDSELSDHDNSDNGAISSSLKDCSDTTSGKVAAIKMSNQIHNIAKGGKDKNMQKNFENVQKIASKPYVPNSKPMEVSNNFAKSTHMNHKVNELTVANEVDIGNVDRNSPKVDQSGKLEEKEVHRKADDRNQPPTNIWSNKILGPNAPVVSHALVTKLRAQEAMKVMIIDITPLEIMTKKRLLAVVFKPEDFTNKLEERYKYTLIGEEKVINKDALNCIPRMVTKEQNLILQAIPTMEELKNLVFSMRPNSIKGTDVLRRMGFGEVIIDMIWQIMANNWYLDDWLGVGLLADHRITDTRPNNIKIFEFLIDGNWNEDMVGQIALPFLVPRILNTHFQFQEGILDQPI